MSLAVLLIKSTVVLVLACTLAALLRRAPASARHLIWSLAAISLLALPVASVWAPEWPLPLPPSVVTLRVDAFERLGETTATIVATPAGVRAPQAPPTVQAGIDWAKWIPAIWVAGVAVLLLRLLLGAAAVARMSRRARPMAEEWNGLLRELSRELGLWREVRLRQTDATTIPLTWGLRRPVILLPGDAGQWPEEQRRMVLVHELAHVRRDDCLTQLLARVAFGLYWFHPLAWLAGREFVKERERACDDLVLSLGARASDYAAQLVQFARSLQPRAHTAWASLAMARRSQLEGRLLAILDSAVRRGGVGRTASAGALLAAICLIVPLGAMRPQSAQPTAQELRQAVQTFPESPETAAGLVRLARATQSHVEAEALYRRALDIQEKTLGPEHPDLLEGLQFLGRRLIRRDPRQAEAYLQRALSISTKAAAPERPNEAEILTDLGLLFNSEDKLAEAEQYYRRAVAVALSDTPETATTLELYAALLRGAERLAESEPMLERARQIRIRSIRERWGDSGAASGVHRIGGAVTAPRLLHKIDPEYSEAARAAKHQGTAIFSVEVGVDGLAHNFQLVRSVGLGLDEKAAEAISQWRFQPGTLNNEPVAVRATIEVNFRLS